MKNISNYVFISILAIILSIFYFQTSFADSIDDKPGIILTDGKTPYVGIKYIIESGDIKYEGVTDEHGFINLELFQDKNEALLTFWPYKKNPQIKMSRRLNFNLQSADTIKGVQQRLQNQSYPVGIIDGVMNEQTVSALKMFQYDHNLKVTGTLTEETLKTLTRTENSTNKRGSSGKRVPGAVK